MSLKRTKNMNLRRNLCIELILLVILGLSVDYVSCSSNSYPREKRDVEMNSLLTEFVTTPLIMEAKRANQSDKARILEKARNLSKVTLPELPDIVSYNGYFRAEKSDWRRSATRLFFWYFPAQVDSENAPVVLFLDCLWKHSITAAVEERNGPFMIDKVGRLKKREESWNKKQNMIYMSDAFDEENALQYWSSSRNSSDSKEYVSTFLDRVLQFFELFPWLRKNDFFVVGERLSNYYVSLTCEFIHRYNEKAEQGEKINLKGMAMGNPLLHLRGQSNIEEYLYESGLIDAKGKEIFLAKQKEVYVSTDNLNFNNGGYGEGSVESLFEQLAAFSGTSIGYETHFNILEDGSSPDSHNRYEWIKKNSNHHALKQSKLKTGSRVHHYTHWGTFKREKEDIVELLENFRVLIYTGNLDVFCSYPNVENYINKLTKPSISINEIKRAERQKWVVDDEFAGYIRKGGNLTEVLIRNAGRYPAIDQPKLNRKLIESFIDGSL